jgi:hypothetical protein
MHEMQTGKTRRKTPGESRLPGSLAPRLLPKQHSVWLDYR